MGVAWRRRRRAALTKGRRSIKTAERDPPCAPDCACGPTKGGPINAELLAISHPSSVDRQQQSATDQIAFVEQPVDLRKIEEDAVQLAVWRRATAPEFVTALSDPSIAAASLPKFAGNVTPDTAAQKVKAQLRAQKKRALTDGGIDELVEDVDQLVRVFAKIAKTKSVFVKLEVLADDGCVFWHQDSVPFRLVATYRGPCTEWVPPDCSKETLRRRQFDSEHARRLSHHDVALFKGRGESRKGSSLLGHPGIVHRSPRISGSGIQRVVLILDIPAGFQSSRPKS